MVRRSVPTWIAAFAVVGASWLTAGASLAPAAGPDDADPARTAREVFQGQEFWWKRIETPTVPTSWLATIGGAIVDFIGWIYRLVGDLIQKILGAIFRIVAGGVTGGSLILYVIIALLLAWALWKLFPAILRWLGGGASAPIPGRVQSRTLAEASDILEQALQALLEGKSAEAIRLALLALIARLEKRGLLRYDTSRTNREYQRELRHAADLAAGFGRVARIYERVWYGGMPAGRDEAEQAIGLCRTLIAEEGLATE